uniref:Soluble ligand binding domain-containing protein n=1 Tax=mine drainage metagenome TaxID=410659 RepID=E6PYQ8_9ZZZZ
MMNTLVYPGDIINVEHIGTIFMVGELMKPGTYPLTGALSVGSGLAGIGAVRHMTLLQALAMAGGVTEIAARSKSILLRTKPDGTREKIMIDIVKLEKGEIADPVLRAGDIFYVPSSYLRNLTNNLFLNLVNAMYVLPALTVVGLP